jgi:ATP-dependent DNA helicase UvrD/PcrA
VRFGRYVVDFLIEQNGTRVAVEADGKGFHDPARDAERDGALHEMGITRVIRFTGGEIFRNADACGRHVAAVLAGANGKRNGKWSPRRQTLDESQKRAVRHRGAAARVLAPAGAGKTRVLVERIAELIEAGVDPSSILALAFNKKATRQLVAQLGELGIPVSPKKLFDDSVVGVRCANFNAFGFRFQRERLGLDFEIPKSQVVWQGLMRTAAAQCGVSIAGTKRGSDPIGELLRARERALADLADRKSIEIELDYIGRDQPVVVDYARIDDAFEALRVQRQIQTFDDQLATAVKVLLQEPRQRAFVQNYFSHVLVDEFQDLNAAQLALVDILARPWRDLFVVGDDDQLIYEWRYAKLTNILDFEKRVPAAETHVLETNYRCSAAIVESSRRVIDHNQNRVAKNIKPRADAPQGSVSYVSSETHDERLAALVAFIRLQRPKLEHWREIAVLCRYKAQQPFVAMALDHAGIPRTPLLRYRLFSERNMQLLKTYLKLVQTPRALTGEELALVVNRPNRFAKNELLAQLRSAHRPWDDFTIYLDQQRELDRSYPRSQG